MDIIVFVITTLGFGVLISIPGILIGRFLVVKGIARDRPILVIAISIGGLFISRLMVPDVHLMYVASLFLFLSPLGTYRHDLWTTFRNGKWWWIKTEDERQPLFNLPVSIIVSIGIGSVALILAFSIWVLITNLLHF